MIRTQAGHSGQPIMSPSYWAELYATAGRLDDAVRLYEELVEDDPTDERLWEDLLRLLRARGDEIGARRAESRCRATLREDLPHAG